MMKTETIEKIKRVEGRLAKGERVKPALKAEHMAQATWYSPRVRQLRLSRDVLQREEAKVPPATGPRKRAAGELPETLKQEIEKLRSAKAMLAKRLVAELLDE